MTNPTQHILPSGLVACVGAWIAWVSYTQEPAEAFLFPRLIATVFLALALWTFGKALLGKSKAGEGLSWNIAKNLLPGLAVASFYIFYAAKTFGFYTAFTLSFFTLLILYDPAPHGRIGTWVKRSAITAGVVGVMYGIFAVVLKVYTPRGVFL